MGGANPFASLQTPASTQIAANQVNANANIPTSNQIQLPSWLQGGANSSMQELLNTYNSIPQAFNPNAQIAARNAAIGYNTSQGNQTANNAASQYANAAMQSGGSTLGAGVVKAQSMLPVMQQNAELRTQGADIAAQSHEEAASLAGQIAGTIGQLRQSYLNSLTQYSQGQQQLALSQYQAQQNVANNAAQNRLGYAQQQSNLFQSLLGAQAQQATQNQQAQQVTNTTKGPNGVFYTDAATGQVTSGQATYQALQNWQNAQSGQGSGMQSYGI